MNSDFVSDHQLRSMATSNYPVAIGVGTSVKIFELNY